MFALRAGDCTMSQFQSRLTHNEEALGDHLSEMEHKNAHTPTGTKKKPNWYAGPQ